MAGNLDYYSAASQVLPLVFIGLAFETRYFTSLRTYGRKAKPPEDGENVNAFWSIGATWVAGLLVCGEWAALDALHDGRPTEFERGLVGASLAGGAAALVAPLVAAQVSAIRHRWREEGWLWLFFVLLLSLVTLYGMDLFG